MVFPGWKIYMLYIKQLQELSIDTFDLPFPTYMSDFILMKAHEKSGLKGLKIFSPPFFFSFGKMSQDDTWEGESNAIAGKNLVFIGFY